MDQLQLPSPKKDNGEPQAIPSACIDLAVGLALILTFPSAFPWLRIVAVALICLAGAIRGSQHRIRQYSARTISLYIALLVLGCCVEIQNTLMFGETYGLSLWVADPAVWLLVTLSLFQIDPDRRIQTVDLAILIAAFAVSFLHAYFVLTHLIGMESFADPIRVEMGLRFGQDSRGFFAFTSSNLAILGFTTPYLLLGAPQNSKERRRRRIALALSILVIVLSLSIALFLVLLAAIAFKVSLRGSNEVSLRVHLRVLFIMGTCGVLLIVLLTLVSHTDFLGGIYQLKYEDKLLGHDERILQVKTWLSYFAEAPLFGNGISSTDMTILDVDGNVAVMHSGTVVNPYGYEVLYGRLLSELGLVWFGLYGLVVAMLLFSAPLERSTNNFFIQGLRLSAFAMLLQTSFNSYFTTFGYMICLALPAMFLK